MTQSDSSRARSTPSITPVFPLLVLEALRDSDRPAEVLEGEDVTSSLPRRLGLSDVVMVQIRRFQGEVKARRLQRAADVEDLIRLVIRRPDAEEIFHEAGRRVARQAWAERSGVVRGALRFSPHPVARLAAARAGRRLLRVLTGPQGVSLRRWPVELRIHDSLTARADPGGAACIFYSGVLEEVLQLYTGRAYRAHHTRCEARGDEVCEWTVRLKA